MKFREENVYSSQIEITEMNIVIGNGLQPRTKVRGLWITGNEQQTARTYRPFKQCSLLANHTKILHILYSYDYDILGNRERLPIRNKHETSFLRIYYHFTAIQ